MLVAGSLGHRPDSPQREAIVEHSIERLSGASSCTPPIYAVLQRRVQSAESHQAGRVESENPARENKTGMPNQLRAGLEELSGFDLSHVRVHHNSPKAAEVNALAYAQGHDIHVGPGQEKHLPHEGWHVVQQMQGRVKPRMQGKGVSINDNAALEHEADLMGARAASGQTHAAFCSYAPHLNRRRVSEASRQRQSISFSDDSKTIPSRPTHIGRGAVVQRNGAARPVGFRTVAIENDSDNDGIFHKVGFSSDTGSLDDLKDVATREVIEYRTMPNSPPFIGFNVPQKYYKPHVLTKNAHTGGGGDHHSYVTPVVAAMIGVTLSNPLVEGVLVADQRYEYNLTDSDRDSDWIPFEDANFVITRRILKNRWGRWKYSIHKRGPGVDFTRTVAIDGVTPDGTVKPKKK